jgi:hypothetical protein
MRNPKRLFNGLVGLSVLTAILMLVAIGTAAHDRADMIDAHSHYTAADAEALSPADVIAALDAAGVSRIVISGSPPELAQRLHAHAPDRVIPFLGVYHSARDKALWMNDASVPARVEAMLADGDWAGIGELHLFADGARSAVFERLVRIAGERGLVLMLHGDAEIVDRAFEIDPEVSVLWAHLGTRPIPELLAAVLARHPERRLWIDTSVRDPQIAPEGVLLPEWRALFEAYPDRFVVAVDAFSPNRWRNYGTVVAAIRAWTDPLPAELRDKLLSGNAAMMLGKD